MTEDLTCPVCYCSENLQPLTCGHDLCTSCRPQLLMTHKGKDRLGRTAIKCPICREVNQLSNLGEMYKNPKNTNPDYVDIYMIRSIDGAQVHLHGELSVWKKVFEVFQLQDNECKMMEKEDKNNA